MADDNSGSNTILGLLVGGLLVFVVIAFAFGWYPGATRTAEVNIKVPKVEVPAPSVPSK
jgi:hypothetical protein